MNRRVSSVLGLLALFATQRAEAGGVALPVRGVRSMSVGGAFVASADDANALWINPSRMDETLLGLEVGVVSLGASYTAADGDDAGKTATNQGQITPNPTLGFTLHVNDTLSLGLGVFAPYSGFERFDPSGPQRYALVDSDKTVLLHLAAGAALRFGKFRIGGSIQNVMADVKQHVMSSGYTGLFGWATDPTLDVLQEIHLQDNFTLTGNLGMSFEMGRFTLGAAVQLPYAVSGDATYKARLGKSHFFDPVTVEGDQGPGTATVHMEIPFPLMVRAGLKVQLLDTWIVEAAANYEGWSVQDKIVIDASGRIKLHGVPGIGDYEVGQLVLDRRMKDTLSLHLGTDYAVAEKIHLRGGLFYERTAFPDETFSVAQFDGSGLGVALGASWEVGPVRLDVAASHVFQGTRTITNSQLKQLNATNPEQAVVIGNGTYESSYWVAGAGATWHMGR